MIDRVLKILENNLFGCITCNIVRIYHFDGAFIIVVAIILTWMGLCNLFHVEFSKVKRTIIFFCIIVIQFTFIIIIVVAIIVMEVLVQPDSC